ncbi:homeobox domain-containing protein [Podospora didyma]|uniref:Homeobox domain-containing protein n=1 Tax=Podospora didyma TaxID=330526 RepID=A0AAE0N2E1_9PEZI|nr:homeobox domain-containing protein [Podospora didyma]
MSMIAMAQPVPHSAFKREFAWDETRQQDYGTLRRQNDTERIALPSIRQAFPDQFRVPFETHSRAPSSTTSPSGFGGGAVSPVYTHSPTQKRRRVSIGEGRDESSSQVPRQYSSPQSHGMSPILAQRSATESWTTSPSRRSPYMTSTGSLGSMRESAPVEMTERYVSSRPTLPPLHNMELVDRGISATMPRVRGRSTDEDYSEGHRHTMNHYPNAMDVGSGSQYRLYSYHHPSRGQSLSVSSVHQFERTPFSPVAYGSGYQDYMRSDGAMGPNGDYKQRKRRGNLPKPTTDILRSWFLAHLSHPYPSEEEKQELMRQTGLQMNQISNWFINARRRQLPTMMMNARNTESDATSSAAGHSTSRATANILKSTEHGGSGEYNMVGTTHHHHSRDSAPLSDGEGSAYDDDVDTLRSTSSRRRHAANMSRGSV